LASNLELAPFKGPGYDAQSLIKKRWEGKSEKKNRVVAGVRREFLKSFYA
jgi:hypothetical protein